MGAFPRWALIRGWALIRINTVSRGGGVGENDSRGEGEAAPIGKNEFKLRLFMLLTFKLIISTIFMYKLNWRSMSKIFLDLTQWGAKVAIVHKIRE